VPDEAPTPIWPRSSTTDDTPRKPSAYAVLSPIEPPPTITTSAVVGSASMLEILQSSMLARYERALRR